MAEMKLLNRFSWKCGFLETKQQWKTIRQDSMTDGVKKNKQGTCFNKNSTQKQYLGELAMTMGMATSLTTNINTAQVPLSQPKGIRFKKAPTNDRDEQRRGSSTSRSTSGKNGSTRSTQQEPKTTRMHDTSNLHRSSPTQGLPPKVLNKHSNITPFLPSIQEQAALFNQNQLHQEIRPRGKKLPPTIESSPENKQGTCNDDQDLATNQGTWPNTLETRNQTFLQWYNLRICLYSKNQLVLSEWEALNLLLAKLKVCDPTIQVYPWQSKDYSAYPPIQLSKQAISFFDLAIYVLRLTRQQVCWT